MVAETCFNDTYNTSPPGQPTSNFFLEQYILAIFVLHLKTIVALQCHANTQGFSQMKLLSRYWELCQEKSKQFPKRSSSWGRLLSCEIAHCIRLLKTNDCVFLKVKKEKALKPIGFWKFLEFPYIRTPGPLLGGVVWGERTTVVGRPFPASLWKRFWFIRRRQREKLHKLFNLWPIK